VARNAAEIKAWLEQLEDSPAREGAARAIEAALSLEEVRGIAAQLPPSGVRTAVEEWLDGEAAQLAAARRDVETWFDDAMQRVTDTYKRRIQWFLYVIATVVVLVAGADSFRLIGNLHSDAALRAQLTAAATAVAGEPMTTTVDAETGLAVVEVNAATMATIEEAFVRLEGSLGYADIVTFDGAGRPVWNLPGDPLAALAKMVLKAMGLLLTVAAVALGAPFWFDVLKRLANLRAVGLPPGQGHPGSGG
jgi:hypothetical protein